MKGLKSMYKIFEMVEDTDKRMVSATTYKPLCMYQLMEVEIPENKHGFENNEFPNEAVIEWFLQKVELPRSLHSLGFVALKIYQ